LRQPDDGAQHIRRADEDKAYQKAELCVTAKLIVEWQRWVKTSKAQNE